jgi:hypothetical protein
MEELDKALALDPTHTCLKMEGVLTWKEVLEQTEGRANGS